MHWRDCPQPRIADHGNLWLFLSFRHNIFVSETLFPTSRAAREDHGKVEGQAAIVRKASKSIGAGNAKAIAFWGAVRRPMTKPEPNCKFDAGVMVPVIDPMRCEAKGPCVPICPYDVLLIRTVPAEEKAKLPLMGRFKLLVHGGKQAFALDPDACRGCGLCVKACPEKAIKLQKRSVA
jgi:4Fe-4S ferredoxin